MKSTKRNQSTDLLLVEAKKVSQERSRQLVRDGLRTQESMFLIPREVAKYAKVHYK